MKKAGATIAPPPAKGEIERGSLWPSFKAQKPNPTPTLPLKKGEEKIDSFLRKKEGENLLLPLTKEGEAGWGLGSTVTIFKANDIILAQVRTGLHLDELQRYLAGVLQSMNLPHRQVNRLVLGDQLHLVTIGNAGRT